MDNRFYVYYIVLGILIIGFLFILNRAASKKLEGLAISEQRKTLLKKKLRNPVGAIFFLLEKG